MTVGGWVLMGVWILAFLVTIWLIIGGTSERISPDDALDILRVRFARGEISESEYQLARSRIAREDETRV